MDFIREVKEAGFLRIIEEEVDIDLEIAHLSYIEVKKKKSQVLLFTNVVDKDGKKYPPVLSNVFANFEVLSLIFKKDIEELASSIRELIQPQKPKNIKEKIDFFTKLLTLKNVFPKRLKSRGLCQEVEQEEVDLTALPALKTWEEDAGRFITMGQVYTTSLDGKHHNVGMYRLQIYDKNRLGMHWQVHKDGANFFNEYKKAGKKMPVSVAIGGDPLYIWCAQAPLPKNVFELLLYGFIRKEPAKLVKSLTNDIYIPHDVDFVIEGFVDTEKVELEGPFGDHTGYYTPKENFPVMDVTKITHRKAGIFHATVVGKPPLEDKYFGYATERIFLPLFQTTAPDLLDYNMPENGVFHNLILGKINCWFPYQARQVMHAFFGVGQMSFVKHAIFVDQNAPEPTNYEEITKYILNRLGSKSLVITEGICDQLDHASPNSCFGGKLAVDVTEDFSTKKVQVLSDEELLKLFQSEDENIVEVKQYYPECKSPLCLLSYKKGDKSAKELFVKLHKFKEHFSVLIILDSYTKLNHPYMLLWKITNSIDALRDIKIIEEEIFIDATDKGEADAYPFVWPKMTNCSRKVVKKLIEKNLLENDEKLFEDFEIFG